MLSVSPLDNVSKCKHNARMTTEQTAAPASGWARIEGSSYATKEHFFDNGKALCGRKGKPGDKLRKGKDVNWWGKCESCRKK